MPLTTRPPMPAPRTGAISYRELDAWGDRIARRLAEHAVGAGSRVLVLADPTLSAVAAVMGVQRAGAEAVVLDPGEADERIAFASARCAAAVASGALAGRLGSAEFAVVRAEECRDESAEPRWPA